MKLEERFWSKVTVGKEDECWNWTASSRGLGYGSFKYNGKVIDSHRMSWFLTYGEFPELMVLHRCDNRGCCNPNHLFLGNYLDNIRDMVSKGRNAKGERTGWYTHPEKRKFGENHPNSKLKDEDVIEIYKLYFHDKIKQTEIAEKFGVRKSTIGDVVKGRGWKHLKNYFDKYS